MSEYDMPKGEGQNPIEKFKEAEFSLDFDQKFGTYELVDAVNKWWDSICLGQGLDPRREEMEKLGYHILEVAKNALEYGVSAHLTLKLKDNQVTVVIKDKGPGFVSPMVQIKNSVGMGGLKQVFSYSTQFSIESNRKRFEKVTVNKRTRHKKGWSFRGQRRCGSKIYKRFLNNLT